MGRGSDDEEEEELAAIRAARQAKLGLASTISLSALRDQKRRAEDEASKAALYLGSSRQQGSGTKVPAQDDDDDDGPVVVAVEDAAAAVGPAAPPHSAAATPAAAPVAAVAGSDSGSDEEVAASPDDGAAAEEDDGMLMHEGMRQYFPLSFGQQEQKVDRPDAIHAQHRRHHEAAGQQGPKSDAAGAGGFGPPRPPVKIKQIGQGDVPGTGQQQLALTGAGEEAGEDDEEDEGEEEEDPYQLPITHEVVLGSSHIKAVTCMDVDHTGNRLVTGSMDMNMRLYDFNGMKRDMKAFRELEAQEGHPVLALSWSPTGELLLAVTGSAKAKIFDRDGHTKGEFVRGDMYIRDPRNTKGHVSALTCGQWHPQDRYTAMTSSEDGTIRIWDTHNIMQKTVVKPTTSKPVRTAVTTCGYGLDGKLIAAGLVDGSIQLWNVSGKFGTSAAVGQVMPPAPQMVEKQGWTYVSKSGQVVRGAHLAGTEITSLAFSQDGHTLLSRSLDSSLKVWDLRKFSQPVKVWADLPCSYASTKVIFSPDEQLAVTGVSAAGEEGGALVFLDTKRHTLVRKVGVPGTATALAWHHRLNQIFVGIGNRKMGSTRVLYDTTYSERGVLIGAARAVRKPSPFDFQPQELVREARVSGKRKRQQEVEAAIKSHKPDPGMAAGMGKQGRIGTTGGTLLTQHLLKQKGKLKPPDLTMDPREAILRHAGKKDVFSQFTAAYKETQPEAIYAVSEDEEEKEDD